MQIIPTKANRELGILKQKAEVNTVSLDTYSSYSRKFGFQNSLEEANKDLLPSSQANINEEQSLSYEELLRLRNELLEAKKITKEEADALSYLLGFGGEHTVEEIQETIANGTKGLEGLKAEEYVALQQFLYSMDFETEGIEKVMKDIKEGRSISALEDIFVKVKSSEGSIQNIIPILNKIFTGKYHTKNPLEQAMSVTNKEAFLLKIEEISAQLSGKDGSTIANDIDILEEIETLLVSREERIIMDENSSIYASKYTDAEKQRNSSSAIEKGFLLLQEIEKKQEDGFTGNTSQEESPYNAEEHSSLKNIVLKTDGSQNSAFMQNTLFKNTLHTTKNIKELSGEHKTEVLKLLSTSVLELNKTNGSKITVELNPRELGRVELSLQYKDGQLSALLRPDKIDVEKTLKDNIDVLIKSLDEQGIKIEKVTILDSKEQWLQYQGNNQRGHQGHHQGSSSRERFEQEIERSGRIRSLLQEVSKEVVSHSQNNIVRLLDTIV